MTMSRSMTLLSFLFIFTLGSAASGETPAETSRREALDHYKAGQKAFLSEDFEEAEREFKASVALDPLLMLGHYGLGQVYMSTRRYPDAVRAFTGGREAFQEQERLRLSGSAAADKVLEDQIRALEDQVRAMQAGNAPQTSMGQANFQRIQSQLEDMKRRRQRGDRQSAPTPPGLSLALGSAHFRNGSMADAEREYGAALAVDPKLGEAHNNLAVVYLLTGRLQEAQKEITLAEKSGFKVSPGLKQDLKKRMEAPPSR
jgi:tetratricopeptide (TPR) repeat protein